MADEKAAPPVYLQAPVQPQMVYAPTGQQVQGTSMPQPTAFGAQGAIGPVGGFQMASPPVVSPGANYQQELMSRCARGDHDVTVKHGMVGIITAIVCFPIGLLALLVDREKRCVRCGSRVG